MAGTRSSERVKSSPQSENGATGTKRKADDTSPSGGKSKRGRPSKEQKTLEESMPTADDQAETKDVEVKDAEANGERTTFQNPVLPDRANRVLDTNGEAEAEKKDDAEVRPAENEDASANALDQVKADENDAGATSKVWSICTPLTKDQTDVHHVGG